MVRGVVPPQKEVPRRTYFLPIGPGGFMFGAPGTARTDQASPVTLSTVDPYATQRFVRVVVGVAFVTKISGEKKFELPIVPCCIDIGGTVTGMAKGNGLCVKTI